LHHGFLAHLPAAYFLRYLAFWPRKLKIIFEKLIKVARRPNSFCVLLNMKLAKIGTYTIFAIDLSDKEAYKSSVLKSNFSNVTAPVFLQ